MEEDGQVQVALEAVRSEAASADLDRHRHLGGERAQVPSLGVRQGVERQVVGDLDAAEPLLGRAPHQIGGGEWLRRKLARHADRPGVRVARDPEPHRESLRLAPRALSSSTATKMTQAMTRG